MAIDPDVQLLLDQIDGRLDALEAAGPGTDPAVLARLDAIELALQGVATSTDPFQTP